MYLFTWLSSLDSGKLNMGNMIFFHDFLLVMLIFTLVFVGFMIIFVWKKKISSNSYVEAKFLELIWTIIPILILVVMFMPSLLLLKFSVNKSSVLYENMVKVMGHQWNWEYEYIFNGKSLEYTSTPEESMNNRLLETSAFLLINSNTNTLIKVGAEDVIHSFALPQLGIKLDAVPGRVKEVVLKGFTNSFGMFQGQCSEICGALHSNMPMMVVCLPL